MHDIFKLIYNWRHIWNFPCSWFENSETRKRNVSFSRKLAMCYCKGNYSVNVSVFGFAEKEFGF